MDYITANLDKKITLFKKQNDKNSTVVLYTRSKIEYMLILIMTYLWNKNFEKSPIETKEIVLRDIVTPTIGTIVGISRKLDLDSIFFANKKFSDAINSYPSLRNEFIGHGFMYDDKSKHVLGKLEELSRLIYDNCFIFQNEYNILHVTKEENGILRGIIFGHNGHDCDYYSCPTHATGAKPGNIYIKHTSNDLIRISPFIHITEDEDIFIFRDIKEKLLGKIRYSQILKTGELYKTWDELCNVAIETDGIRLRAQNSTIVNRFENNYKKYIEIGIKKQIVKFLTKNKSSVCATIWGHGGVGKTATVQSVCNDLCLSTKTFDYIIFFSAKDRYYNYYSGEVVTNTHAQRKFSDFIELANDVIHGHISADPAKIIGTEFKTLIIIDDYETFPSDEKRKIKEFISSLDITRHKALITTRAHAVIGEEIVTNELSADKTLDFLFEILSNEFGINDLTQHKQEISTNNYKSHIHTITSGRPIFIFQLAFLWMQNGNIDKIIDYDFKNADAAFDFLYGRIFDYLSTPAKEIFCAISQLIDESDLSSSISSLTYAVGMEEKQDAFNSALDELRKLKIVENDEKVFRAYSKEILEIMGTSFSKLLSTKTKSRISKRVAELGHASVLVLDDALLKTANSSRYSNSEEDVVALYENILDRDNASQQIKFEAILNVTNYLASDRGKRQEAIEIAERHSHCFTNDNRFTKLYAKLSWSAGGKENKTKAITYIEDYFKSPLVKLHPDDSICLDIFSLLIMYKSIYWIEERKDLKALQRVGAIEPDYFHAAYADQRNNFYRIIDEGSTYFNFIHRVDIRKIAAEEQINVVTALGLLADVAVRVRQFDLADEICIYAITHLHRNEQSAFQRRLAYIENYKRDSHKI